MVPLMLTLYASCFVWNICNFCMPIIMNFKKKENKSYFRCWGHFNELLVAYPHHGYEIWRVISSFYDELDSQQRQFIEMICNGGFLNKGPEEARDYLEPLLEDVQLQDTSNGIESPKQLIKPKGTRLNLLKEGKDPKVVCGICECDTHLTQDCPTISAFKEVLHEQANAMNTYQRPFSCQKGTHIIQTGGISSI